MNPLNDKVTRTTRHLALALLASFALTSCGGGGPTPTPTPTAAGVGEVVISGRAAKGTILNATIRATQIINGQLGGAQKEVALGANGEFSVSMPKGLVHLQVIPNANSTTQDEATGVAVALPPEFKFRAAADLTDSTATTVSLNITSFSEAGVALAEKSGGLTAANINKANSGIANILGFDHLSTTPIQSSDSVALASATTNEKKLSLLNAAVSNMAATDALGCGVKATYGQTIDCTVAKLADQFQMNSAASAQPIVAGVLQTTTANSTPMVLFGDAGYQASLLSIANARGFSSPALANTYIDNSMRLNGLGFSLSPATYVSAVSTCPTLAICEAAPATQKEAAKLDYQSSIKDNRYDLIDNANIDYKYALISKLVYDDQWVNGKNGGGMLPAPLENYAVVNWNDYFTNPSISPSDASNIDLYWNAFYNSEEIVFAYRGTITTSLLNWVTDYTAAVHDSGGDPLYALAWSQFNAALLNPKFKSDIINNKNTGTTRKIVLTGHSLGGGVASYIAGTNSSVYSAVVFNTAPLGSDPSITPFASKIKRDVIIREPVSSINADFGTNYYYPGDTVKEYPDPYSGSTLTKSHNIDTVLFALGAAKDLCTSSICLQNSTHPYQPPTTTIPLVVNGIQSSYSTGVTPYRPPISLSGTNLSAINQISWACTQPNGAACPGSPYVWTPSNWAGKVDIFNDTSIKVYPGLLALGDAAGTYNWSVTFSALNSTPVSIPFSVTYQPQLATGIVVDGLSSAMFTLGTTTISTTTNPVVAALAVTGKNLGTVAHIEWRWSGAATGSATWRNTDSTWSSKVAYTPDGKLALSPTVVEANPAWSGTVVWTGTLMDAAGVSRNITFSVVYQPPATVPPPTTCTQPQVLTNGVCVTPPTNTYSISGSAGLPGVTMTLSGASSAGGATTDANGNYTFGNLANGSYTVAPALSGYSFTPSSLVLTVNGANIAAANFTATSQPGTLYSITGTVTASGSALSGVTMTLSGANSGAYTTGSNGMYGFALLANGSYTVTPSLSGYTFTPTSSTITISGANIMGANFTGSATSTSTAPAVLSLAATSVTSTSAQMNASVNPNGSSTTTYFEYGTTTSYGSTTGVGGSFSGTTAAAVNYSMSGLSPNTTYHYRVVATNSGGTSRGSDVTFTTGTALTAPTVQSLAATLVTSTTAQMNGSINPNGLSTSGYFEYGTTTSYGSTTGPGTFSGTTAIAIQSGWSGLAPSTTYHYRAVATNSGGTSIGGDVSFTTTATPLVVNGVASSYTGTGQQTIPLTGSGFNSINQISWSCTNPNGTICTGSPYVWTPGTAKWGNVTITSDTVATVYPTFLVSTDPAGTYNWSVTFSGGGQSVTKYFTAIK